MFTKNYRSIKRKIKETKELLKVYTALLILLNLSSGQITSTFEPIIRDGRWNTASKCYQSPLSRINQSFCKFFVIFGVRLGKPLNEQTPFKNDALSESNFENFTSFESVSLTNFKADSLWENLKCEPLDILSCFLQNSDLET